MDVACTDITTTCSCSALLCLMWCSKVGGTPVDCGVKKTAVPGTRRIGCVFKLFSKWTKSRVCFEYFSIIILRPRIQVSIKKIITEAMSNVSQPPLGILNTLVTTKSKSTVRKIPQKIPQRISPQPLWRNIKIPNNIVTIAISIATASPYAWERCSDVRKLSTMRLIVIIAITLSAGT